MPRDGAASYARVHQTDQLKGMATRELIRFIQNVQGVVVGADIVDYNPYRDIQNMTAMVAAKLMKELAAKMLSQP
jgi:arginase family enzyme